MCKETIRKVCSRVYHQKAPDKRTQWHLSNTKLVKVARNIWACRLDLSRQIRLKCTITPHSSTVALHTRLHSMSIPWGPHCSIWIIYQFPLCYIQNQLFGKGLPIFTGIYFIVLLTNRHEGALSLTRLNQRFLPKSHTVTPLASFVIRLIVYKQLHPAPCHSIYLKVPHNRRLVVYIQSMMEFIFHIFLEQWQNEKQTGEIEKHVANKQCLMDKSLLWARPMFDRSMCPE